MEHVFNGMARRFARPTRRRALAGFTLIEMVITVAIIGILTAIAYPIYQGFVERSRRSDAITTLQDIAQQQERWYTQNNEYDNGANIRVAEGVCGADGTCVSEQGFYTITIALTDADQVFTATADTTGIQVSDDACDVFTINSVGQRTAVNEGGTDNTDCW